MGVLVNLGENGKLEGENNKSESMGGNGKLEGENSKSEGENNKLTNLPIPP